MLDCKYKQENLQYCNCSYSPCSKKGVCCECLHYHLRMGEVPGCFFSDEIERTWDRSIENYLKHKKKKG